LFLIDAYEYDSWKKFFEFTKQQESSWRIDLLEFVLTSVVFFLFFRWKTC